MAPIANVVLRGRTFHFRRRVPTGLRATLRLNEMVGSLGTSDARTAKLRALPSGLALVLKLGSVDEETDDRRRAVWYERRCLYPADRSLSMRFPSFQGPDRANPPGKILSYVLGLGINPPQLHKNQKSWLDIS